jgi:hypothetical protein
MRHLDLLTCSAALAATDPCSSMSPEISQSPQGHLKSDFAGRAQQGSRPATEISSCQPVSSISILQAFAWAGIVGSVRLY